MMHVLMTFYSTGYPPKRCRRRLARLVGAPPTIHLEVYANARDHRAEWPKTLQYILDRLDEVLLDAQCDRPI
jgi:hypothetical protein